MYANQSFLSRQPLRCTKSDKGLWLLLVIGTIALSFLFCSYHLKRKTYEKRIRELETERDGRMYML